MKKRKYLALLLAAAICLSLIPGAAMAEGIELAEEEEIFLEAEEVFPAAEEPQEEVLPEPDAPEEEAIVEAEPEEPAIVEEPAEPEAEPEPEPEEAAPAEEPEEDSVELRAAPVEDLETFSAPAADEAAEDVIVGFEELGDEATVSTPYKLALIELEKLFPAELNVFLGAPEAAEDRRAESLAVAWECLEDYDEDVSEFHFTPVLDRPLAEGLALPVVTVLIEGRREQPVLAAFPELPGGDLPIVGILTNEALPRNWGVLPAYYNAYEQGLLPPIRDQNPYGTCWAHASIGCMEADLIHDGAADTGINLSELHLVYYTFHNFTDEKGCSSGDTVATNGQNYLNHGGDIAFAVNRMSQLVGPAREADAPYFLATSYDPGPDYGRADNCALQLSGSYSFNIQDRDAIKYNIQTHGGVETAYCAADAYYSSRYNSYYCPINYDTNHSVMLVGWNDNFPSQNFAGSYKPEGNGAWLVRNSWGGDGYSYYSYFWISYYDKSLKDIATALDVTASQHDYCYAYDGSPFSSNYSMSSGVMTEQSFTVNGGERISAIGVETGTASLNLAIRVSCGSKTVTKNYSTTYPGYYLIPLDETIPVYTDSRATVQITYTGSGDIKIPVEYSLNYGGIVYTATCQSGGMTITDPDYNYTFNTNSDGRIKLFTNRDNTPAPAVPTCTFSLNLQDVIGINFLVGGLTDYSGMTISWTKKDGTEVSMPVTDGVLQSNGKYYFQLDLFAAKELARAVPVTITAADGTVLKEASCSVKSYCEKVQTMSGYGNLKALCAKMLEYGYAAQQLFQYDLANPILDAAPAYPAMAAPTASGDYKSGASKTLGGNGITGASANVSLESRIEFFVTLKHDGTANLADYEITVDNSGKYTSVEKSNTGSGFLVKIKGINAKDLGTDFTVSAKKGGVVSSITVSPLTYCYVKQKSATATENAKNLSRGLYAYGHAARVYADSPYM